MGIFKTGVVVLGLFLVAGCDSKELNRPKATVMINSSSQFSPSDGISIEVSNEFTRCALSKGLWSRDPAGNYAISPKGSGSFTRIGRPLDHNNPGFMWVKISGNHKRTVKEIGGITAPRTPFGATPEHLKVAHFVWEWSWDEVNIEVIACLGNKERPAHGGHKF